MGFSFSGPRVESSSLQDQMHSLPAVGGLHIEPGDSASTRCMA